jgi:hypothetical protein
MLQFCTAVINAVHCLLCLLVRFGCAVVFWKLFCAPMLDTFSEKEALTNGEQALTL